MTPEVKALSDALDRLREELLSTPRTAEGFGEMRALYRELTLALIDAGDKSDRQLAKTIESVSKEIVEEWESNKAKFGRWEKLLRPVVGAVSAITSAASLSNPLTLLLSR